MDLQAFEKQGERIKSLKFNMRNSTFTSTLFDDGIEVRSVNYDAVPPNTPGNTRVKQHTRLIDIFSCRIFTAACLLGSIPHVEGAPISPGNAILVATHEFESFMDGLGSILIAVAPLTITAAGAARLWYILRWPTRELAHPIYSGALATMAGFAYWAVRHAVGESAGIETAILAVFMACWTSFVADSRRKVDNKKQYFLSVVFGGGIVCLLATALQYIDQEPHSVSQRTTTTALNQTADGGQSFEQGALGSQEATAFLTLAKTNGPILLILTSVVIYIWQSYTEVGSEPT